MEAVTADVPRKLPWTAIVQEDERRIDLLDAAGALGPQGQIDATLELRGEMGDAEPEWAEAAAREWRSLQTLMARTPAERRRFAVFSLGQIPLAVQLGYCLGDRARVALFQYDRDRGSWAWDGGAEPGDSLSWQAIEGNGELRDEAAIRVSLSAEVRPDPGLRFGVEIDIRARRHRCVGCGSRGS